ncbi:MAG: winged helix-turn-helix domain-containing protein, partial [Anaerolineales bacterium]
SSVTRGLAYRAEKQQKKLLLQQLESSLKRLKDAEGVYVSPDVQTQTVELGDNVVFDTLRRDLWRGNQHVSLTPTESKLLLCLVENRGQVITHRELVNSVQGYDVKEWEAPEVLRPLISRLRRKLSTFPGAEEWVVNIRGTGYLFEA